MNLLRRRALDVSIACAAVMSAVSLVPASAAPCALRDLSTVQPVDAGVLKVARVAGASAGMPDTWEMKVDGWFCNATASDYIVTSVQVQHFVDGVLTKTLTSTPTLDGTAKATVPANNGAVLVFVRDTTRFDFPLPDVIRLTFSLTTSQGAPLGTIMRSYPVAEHTNPGPLTGAFFPFRQSDLPAGAYWMQDRHAENNNFQRWAYDLMVQRWFGLSWTSLKSGGDQSFKESYLAWDRPVYAMSDGEIIGCNRGGVDNNPSSHVGNVPGGNVLWVRYGDETMLYAHLKQFSIPFSLCPFMDDQEHKLADPNADPLTDAPFRIRAGQYLGQTGASGWSRDVPHLHIHAFRGLPGIWGGSETGMDADARPLRFVNVRVQPKRSSSIAPADWHDLSSAALLPYSTRIQPNDCGFVPADQTTAEVVHLGVLSECFMQMTNAMVYTNYRAVHMDAFETSGTDVFGGNTIFTGIWRKADRTRWAMYAGLDDNGLQSQRTFWVDVNGYRLLELESYSEFNVMRYVAIFVLQPGSEQSAQSSMFASEYDEFAPTQAKKGQVPVSVSVAEISGAERYSALFEKGEAGSVAVTTEVALADYQAEFNARTTAGQSLSYIDGHMVGHAPFISAIWYSSLTGGYTALHGLTKEQMEQAIAQNSSAGRFTRTITAYNDHGVKYAAVWRPQPDTTITTGPPSITPSTSASFSFASSDPLATFECALDSLIFVGCPSPAKFTGLAIGTHTLRVRARDRQSLRDPSPAMRSWVVGVPQIGPQ